MDTELLLETYATLGATGFCVFFLGYMLINLVKSQKAQDTELEAIRENLSRQSEIISKLVDKTTRINESQQDSASRRFETLMKEIDDVSDKISYISGRINGSSRP